MYSDSDFKDFEEILKQINLKVVGFLPGKTKCIKFPDNTMSGTVLTKKIFTAKIFLNQNMHKILTNGEVENLAKAMCEHKGLMPNTSQIVEEQLESLQDFTLAKDMDFTTDKEPTYFLVNDDDRVSQIPAHHYISLMDIKEPDKAAMPLIRDYNPRGQKGLYKKKLTSREEVDHINAYIPPAWLSYEGEVPDELPREIEILFNQVTDEMDRKFFLHWIYQSITSRAQVYLVLCGDPAVGKNRMKSVIRALHGNHNSVDGKKSTLVGSFNSQLANCTYIHFDELKYTYDEENIMKEIPNGTVPIEEKFKNTTRSTKIHCSIVISNNKPRDNYISFDARKFAPITLSGKRLDSVLTKDEIQQFSEKIEFDDSPEFDIKYVAQIGRWILKHGNNEKLFRSGEYIGRKFWELAHSSMFHWQKATIKVLTDLPSHSKAVKMHSDMLERGEMWFSEVQQIAIKSRNIKIKDGEFPGDFTSAMYFLRTFRTIDGKPAFECYPSKDSIYGDFKIKSIAKIPAEDLL
jgi:hypothetical protein